MYQERGQPCREDVHGTVAIELHDLDACFREHRPNPYGLVRVPLGSEIEQPGCITTAGVQQSTAASAALRVFVAGGSRLARVADGVLLALMADAAAEHPVLAHLGAGEQFGCVDGTLRD
jgi:hypothetical protein